MAKKKPTKKKSAAKKKPKRAKTSKKKKPSARRSPKNASAHVYCNLKEPTPRSFAPGMAADRERLIVVLGDKWANGTKLRYHFLNKSTDGEMVFFQDGTSVFVPWKGSEAEKDVCLLYTSPSPRDLSTSRMPSSA